MIKHKDIHDERDIRLITNTLDNNYNLVTGLNTSTDDNAEQEEKKDNKKILYIINKYSQEIPLAESIFVDNIPYFIQIIDGKPIYKQEIELSDINIAPPDRTEHIGKEYSFSSFEEVQYFIDLAKNETLDSIANRVKTELKKYLDPDDEDFINILAADIVFTYFQDKLGMTHYLLIIGDNNTGKSNVLLLFSFLGYRPILDIAITPANIYNFGSQLEEGQCIILEDEIDDIDFQDEKKKLYKVSYRSGTKVTRMYESNNSGPINNSERKSSRQQSFFLFGFKMFASEKMPDKIKSKGFLERVIPLKVVVGDPPFDISEIADESGDEKFKELYQQLMNTQKLLLMYRLLHHAETIQDIKLNIKNRYKQLTKPVIRLFQNTESVDAITKSLSKYLIEKNEEKINSLDSALLFLIIDLVAEKGKTTLYNNEIWEKVKEKYPGNEIEGKSYSYFSDEFNTTISKNRIHTICTTKFYAKEYKDDIGGRGLIFNQKKLNKLTGNYSIINGIKIISSSDTSDNSDTFTEYANTNDKDSITKNVNDMTVLTPNLEKRMPQNNNIMMKNDIDIDTKTNRHSLEMSEPSEVSGNRKDIILKAIRRRSSYSDTWECDNCNWTGDIHFMKIHPCKFNKKKYKK